MNELADLRKQIDSIDMELITLLKKRMDVVSRVGAYKKAHGLAPLDATRFVEVLESRIAIAEKKGLSADLIQKIWHIIHEAALEKEAL